VSCAKTAEPIEIPFGCGLGFAQGILHGSIHWRHLLNYSDHLLLLLGRVTILRAQMRSIATERVAWSVGLPVGLSGCHSSEPCKNGSTDQDAVWVENSGGP